MGMEKARGELEKAEKAYSQLPMMVKMQAAGVLLPVIGSLWAILDEVEQLKGRNENAGKT